MTERSDGSAYYTVDSYTGTIPFTLTAGFIVVAITPTSTITYVETEYKFTFTPEHAMPVNSYVVIVHPTELQITDASKSASLCTGFVNFDTSPLCEINTSSRTITVRNGFKSAQVAAGTQMEFTVPYITNPINQVTTSTFSVTTYTENGYAID